MRSEYHQCFLKHKLKNEITSENFQIMSIVMSKAMQNLVVLMEPSEDAYFTPLQTGNMILNRFCIDEDAAFELSGVNSLKKYSDDLDGWNGNRTKQELKQIRSENGKENSFLWSFIILRNLIFMQI